MKNIKITNPALIKFSLVAGLYLASMAIVIGFTWRPLPAKAITTPTGWQKGVTLQPRWPEDFGSPNTDAAIDQARQTNANYVALVIPLQQDNISSTNIYRASYAPTDAALIHATNKAHSLGMKVSLKIHLDPQDGQWRANINPTDRNAWYSNYGNFMNYFADLSRQNNIEQMIIGGELISMSTSTSNPDNTQRWQTIISQVRQRYSGLLTYSANWGGSFFTEEFPHIGFWGQLDFIGISAYFGLANYNNPSVSDIMNAWNNWNTSKIQPFQQSVGKPVLFTEVGYRSVDGSLINPWDYNHQGAYNAQEQINGIDALMQYWTNYPWFSGLQYWAWSTDATCCGAGNTAFEVQNKPGQTALANDFGAQVGGGGGGTTPAFLLLNSSVAPASAVPGTTLTMNAGIKATNAASVVVDMEVYNSTGAKVYQQVASNQSFAANETRNYAFAWATPTNQATGEYTLSIGIFSNDWTTNYTWSSNAASFALTVGTPVSPTATPTATPTVKPTATPVGQPTATPTPVGQPTATPTPAGNPSYSLAIWWPSNGVTLQGIQTIKAKINELNLNQYKMYWQVDGRALNLMADQVNEGAHKEAVVDTSTWNWKGAGPYTLTFVAKGLNGVVLKQAAVQIYTRN